MPSQSKQELVSGLSDELKKSVHVVVTQFKGLTTDELNELRARLLTIGSKYKVIKNRLAKIVFKNVGWTGLDDSMKGSTAIAYNGQDSAALVKILYKFSEDHKNLYVKAGHLFGKAVDANSIKSISALPSRDVLLAILLARLNNPLQSLAQILNEPLRALHASLTALASKRETTPAA